MNNPVLRNAYLNITLACEYKCPFCYATDIKKPAKDAKFYPSEKIYRIMDILGQNNIKQLSLVGGNPVLHPDFDKFVAYAKEHVGFETLTIMTNTAVIKDESIPYIDVLMVTVHSQTASKHDLITSVDGSYSDLIDNLKHFQAKNQQGKIKIAVNVIPQNYNHLFEIAQTIKNEGLNIDTFVFQRIAPVSLTRLNEEFLINAEEANVALKQMICIRKELGINTELVDPYPLCFVDKENMEMIVQCKCGISDINVNGNGDTSRCGADPSYQLGNILETPISELWNCEELVSFRKREYLPKECESCAVKIRCGGGCPMSTITYKLLHRSHLDMFRKKK